MAKLPYEYALDGISNTQTINPDALGHTDEDRIDTLVSLMDGYFDKGAHHLNVNIFGTEKLIDAMEHPEKPEYANFTIRVLKLKEKDCLGQAVAWLKKREADLRDAQVEIVPLVIAWGDYMAGELYNSQDSFM